MLKCDFIVFSEALVCEACVEKTTDSWKDEFDEVVLSLLQDKQPSYLIYQLSSKNEWLLITYSPDDAPVSDNFRFVLFYARDGPGLRFCNPLHRWPCTSSPVSVTGLATHPKNIAQPAQIPFFLFTRSLIKIVKDFKNC